MSAAANASTGGGTSIGNSDGFELAVHSGSLDVTITVTGPHGNALCEAPAAASSPLAASVHKVPLTW